MERYFSHYFSVLIVFLTLPIRFNVYLKLGPDPFPLYLSQYFAYLLIRFYRGHLVDYDFDLLPPDALGSRTDILVDDVLT